LVPGLFITKINPVPFPFGAGDDRLADVRELFGKMSTDLETHMLHEEEALFPMVRDMETVGSPFGP